MELKDRITEELKKVIDPETNLDVTSMGLIRNLAVTEEGNASMDFIPSSPACLIVFTLALNVRNALKRIDGIKNLNITVKEHRMADEVNSMLKEE